MLLVFCICIKNENCPLVLCNVLLFFFPFSFKGSHCLVKYIFYDVSQTNLQKILEEPEESSYCNVEAFCSDCFLMYFIETNIFL